MVNRHRFCDGVGVALMTIVMLPDLMAHPACVVLRTVVAGVSVGRDHGVIAR